MQNKYGNRKTMVNGIVFDSKKEANRYEHLRLLEMAGKIRNLRLQVEYELIPPQYTGTGDFYKSGLHKGEEKKKLVERAVKYYADFVYLDLKTGKEVVEDTKGKRTKEYIIKRKLMLDKFGIKISEV